MNIKEHFHRGADLILKYPNESDIYKEIKFIAENCPIPYYAAHQPHPVKQPIMNVYFSIMFIKYGWECEPLASNDSFGDNLRADYRKEFNFEGRPVIVQIEVEFGNAASYYRDYFKFQLSYFDKKVKIDLGILICPCNNMSGIMNSGLGDYQKVVRELPSAKDNMTVPTYVIGLDFDINNIWDLSQETKYINELGLEKFEAMIKGNESIEKKIYGPE